MESNLKRVHTKEILEKLVELFSKIEFVKSVSKGELSNLPSPKFFKKLMPMVFISPGRVVNEYVNNDPRCGILNQTYNFNIIYVKHVDLENEDYDTTLDTLMEEGEEVAQAIMEDDTLGGFKNASGMILGSLVKDVDFNSNSYQIFKDLQVPASICAMSLEVYYRSMRQKF